MRVVALLNKIFEALRNVDKVFDADYPPYHIIKEMKHSSEGLFIKTNHGWFRVNAEKVDGRSVPRQ